MPIMKTPSPFCRLLCCYFAAYLAVPGCLLAQTPFYLTQPSFPGSNTVRVTVADAPTNVAVTVYAAPLLSTNTAWTPVTTGSVGQTVFDLARTTNASSFYRASHEPPGQTLTVTTPVLAPGAGSYPLPTNVVITCATEGAAIFFTTNGATPTTTDSYIANGGSVSLACSVTLKAGAFKSGFTDSDVASASYTINCPPVVNAGTQQVIYASSTTLQGFVTDDGLTGGGTRFTNWSQVTGPGTVTFDNASLTNSGVTFGADGIYVLKLSASDGQYTNSSEVTVGVNPTLSVVLTAPSEGSTYTVPTNFLVQAEAGLTGGGGVTQVWFYAGSLLIGTDESEPFSVEWKNVPEGDHVLRAVAVSTNLDNFSLASDPVNISVAWPTNVGQVTLAEADLSLPGAGLPIEVNRVYDTRHDAGAFGTKWQLDYESIRIEKSAALGSGYLAQRSGGSDCIIPDHDTVVTVSLSRSEQVPSFVHASCSKCSAAASASGPAPSLTCRGSPSSLTRWAVQASWSPSTPRATSG